MFFFLVKPMVGDALEVRTRCVRSLFSNIFKAINISWYFVLNDLEGLGVSKNKKNWGRMERPVKSETRNNDDFLGFPKTNPKIY